MNPRGRPQLPFVAWMLKSMEPNTKYTAADVWRSLPYEVTRRQVRNALYYLAEAGSLVRDGLHYSLPPEQAPAKKAPGIITTKTWNLSGRAVRTLAMYPLGAEFTNKALRARLIDAEEVWAENEVSLSTVLRELAMEGYFQKLERGHWKVAKRSPITP